MATAGDGDLALFWNKKEFAAAGITRPPATRTQLMADAKKLTRPDGKQYGIYIPVGDAEWISFDWETLLYADGGSVMNGNLAKTAFDSPAGINALTTWMNLRRDGDAPAASYAQAGSYDGAPAFASGTVAMIIDGQWALPEFQQAGVDFGVAPFPAGDAGEATSIGIGVAAPDLRNTVRSGRSARPTTRCRRTCGRRSTPRCKAARRRPRRWPRRRGRETQR